MSYFEYFPFINYQFDDETITLYQNLSIRPDVIEQLLAENNDQLESYTVQDGETPETIAYDAYGDVSMHWVIMLVNRVMNIYTDWPMSEKQINEYLNDKYRVQKDSEGIERILDDSQVLQFIQFAGSPDNKYSSHINLKDSDNSPKITLKPHHLVDNDGNYYSYEDLFITIDPFGRKADLPTLIPVSHEEYEFSLNDAKKEIYLVPSSIAIKMKKELRKLVNE